VIAELLDADGTIAVASCLLSLRSCQLCFKRCKHASRRWINSCVIIIIMLPNQAIASTPSAPRTSGAEGRGSTAPLCLQLLRTSQACTRYSAILLAAYVADLAVQLSLAKVQFFLLSEPQVESPKMLNSVSESSITVREQHKTIKLHKHHQRTTLSTTC
jgi:hypothetical protein